MSRNVVYESQILQNTQLYDPADLVDYSQQQAPRFIDRLPEVVHVKERELVHLEARLLPIGDASMTVEWTIDGKPFTTGSRFRTISDFGYVVLEILEAYGRDSGEYVCRATNQFGTKEIRTRVIVDDGKTVILESQLPVEYSQNIELLERRMARPAVRHQPPETPFPAPKFVQRLPATVTAGEGEAILLQTRIEPAGDGEVEVIWYRNGEELKSGHRHRTVVDFGVVSLEIISLGIEVSVKSFIFL